MTKIVRVKPECLHRHYTGLGALMALDKNGYLWISTDKPAQKIRGFGTMHTYRSLATGYEYQWFASEVEDFEEIEDD